MSQEPTYVGIDVSKEQVDVAVRPTGRSWSVSYNGASVDDLVTQLKDLKPAGVITESTGGLELPLVAALAAASLPVAVVNPRQVSPNPPKSRGISAGAWVKDAARWRCGYDADAGAF